MKRVDLVWWHDDAIGQGWRIFLYGDLLGTAGTIALARQWVRQWWQDGRPAL